MSKAAVLRSAPAWTLGTRPVKRFTGVPSPDAQPVVSLPCWVPQPDAFCARMTCTGELQPGVGEYALASHYEVCSTATTEPAFTIPGGRGIGSSK